MQDKYNAVQSDPIQCNHCVTLFFLIENQVIGFGNILSSFFEYWNEFNVLWLFLCYVSLFVLFLLKQYSNLFLKMEIYAVWRCYVYCNKGEERGEVVFVLLSYYCIVIWYMHDYVEIIERLMRCINKEKEKEKKERKVVSNQSNQYFQINYFNVIWGALHKQFIITRKSRIEKSWLYIGLVNLKSTFNKSCTYL